ncbi:GAF domain-containing protein [Candidatus Thiosymbion oneisti]|uniref:GAF domain-containing protein n=1 Tax=Candidatus Thiosymbion oneisti TaxID=589554 RepID=UPI000ABFE552|nr:GAF domain-containing protein [Candidatus Thiosymbion oneisti]
MGTIASNDEFDQVEPVLDALCELAHELVGAPVAIWVKNTQGGAIVPRGQAGVGLEALTEAIADIEDGSLVARVIASGKEAAIPDIRQDPVLARCRSLAAKDRLGLLAFPAHWRSETLGAIGLFVPKSNELPKDFGQSIRRHLDRIGILVGEHAGRVRRRWLLATATRAVARSLDINEAMRIIVEVARKLTDCDASVLWLLDSRTNRFTLGGRSAGLEWPVSRPRSKGGLTRAILEQGESIRIDDTHTDKRVREGLVKRGVRSLIGVPINRQDKTIGVLFVNSLQRTHFIPSDVSVLEAVAGQVSAGLGWARRVLTSMDEVERAVARLFRLEDTLRDLCERIQAETGFDYVAVQLVRPEERTIETVFGTGDTDWTGIAKHAMDTKKELRDIQVDVVRSHPRRIEIIHGQDPRFDAWIYQRYSHQDYVRAWVPILLVRDGSGRLVKDWWRDAHWQEGPEKRLPEGGWQYALELQANIEEGYPWVYPLGTLDAGYKDPNRRITPEQARRLADLVSEGAIKVRVTQLPSVLETVADGLRRILHADAASLHFSYTPNPTRPERFTYEVAVGDHGLRFFHRAKPGHHRLGHAAIEHRRPRFVPDENRGEKDDAVKELAPNLYEQGVKAIAAFPLVVDRRKSILYVYFHTDHCFTEDEIRWGETFSHKAENAIRNATRELRGRDQARYLTNMYNIAHMMVTTAEPDRLLNDIAGYAANILAADVVTIYEYLESKQRFSYPPARAGRLIDSKAAHGTVPENAVRIIEDREIHYLDDCLEGPEVTTKGNSNFVVREGIKSRILCPLQDRDKMVGAMFVNYRVPRQFGTDDKEVLVPALTAVAALTIRATRNQEQIKQDLHRKNRERDALRRVDQAIVTGAPDEQHVMELILKEAMDITDAKAGSFFQYDPWQKRLDVVAQYGFPKEGQFHRQNLSQGIIGQVARTRKPVLVEDVTAPEWQGIYYRVLPETRGELAIPLQDENGLWGVLNMEHPQPGAFGEDDLGLLETFAIQAMIAVHSVDLYKRLERQIRPLRSLSVIYSRIQDPQHDLDTILRLLLTGVTTGAGLGFTRALLFLNDEGENDAVYGRMAIGAKTQKEADATWKYLKIQEKQLLNGPDDKLDWYLGQAEQFQAELRAGKADDHPLSQATQRQRFSARELGGAFHRCLVERKAVIVGDSMSDPFRIILRKITGTEEGNHAFACVPLVGRAKTEGVLMVDYRFLWEEREIDDKDRISLDAYAGVAAMAIENLNLRKERENAWRDSAWRYFARQTAHSIGNRIAQAEGSAFVLQSSLGDVAGEDSKVLFERLQEEFEIAKELLTRWRNLLKPAKLDLQRLDLGYLLKKVERENRDRLGGVRLIIDLPEPSIELMGDELLLTDTFAELIKNALESMASEPVTDPSIVIRAHREESSDQLCIEVVNPGPGIPEQSKQSIFEPFSSTKGKGRGLGLATIKQSIEAHGGTIEETGTPGEAARFVIRLPLLNAEIPNNRR